MEEKFSERYPAVKTIWKEHFDSLAAGILKVIITIMWKMGQ